MRTARFTAIAAAGLISGIVGAIAGSWIGGLHPAPLPDNATALRIVHELTPGITPAGDLDRRDYVYGSRLGDEESGMGYVEIPYQLDNGDVYDGPVDCSLDAGTRAAAAEHGWTGFTRINGLACTEWRAQRGHYVIAYTHDSRGPVVTFYRPTTGATLGTIIGALLGAAAGAYACRAWNRRPWVLLLSLTPPAVALVPIAALAVDGMLSDGWEEPIPPFWTTWAVLGRLFFRYTLFG